MAKSSKNAANHSGKTITDYFSRRPSQPKSSQSSTEYQCKPSKATPSSRAGHKMTTPSFPETSPSPSIPERLARASSSKAMPEPISSRITDSRRSPSVEHHSLTRSSTPEVSRSGSLSRTSTMSPMKPAEKRKAKFGLNVDTEPDDSVLYIPRGGSLRPTCGTNDGSSTALPTPLSPLQRSSRREARKRIRFSSPESGPELDEIPGSQSEEDEIMPSHKEIGKETSSPRTKDGGTIAQWHQMTSFTSPDTSMEVDEFHTPVSFALDTNDSSMKNVTPPFCHQLTPPPSCLTETNQTPPVLDQATKTAQIIAQIRARAQAAANSSPEDAPIIFKEELSDSEDDDMLLSPLVTRKEGKDKSVLVETLNNSRYNLRGSSALASRTKRRSVSPTRNIPRKRPENHKKISNPLDALLREKKQDDRRGGGAEALERAEKALAGKNSATDNKEDDDYQNWQDETAAREAVLQHEVGHHSSSPAQGMEIEEMDFDESDGQRLFGDEKGDAIRSTITSEREQRRAAQLRNSNAGIPLWIKSRYNDQVMSDGMPSCDFGDIGQDPIACMLRNTIQNSTTQAILLLNAGVLGGIELRNCAGLTEYFCNLALSAKGNELGRAAYYALLNRWNSAAASTPGITLQSCIDAVARMGADMDRIGLSGAQSATVNLVDYCEREALLFRLVSLVTSCARLRLLNSADLPSIILLLLAISLDPSTSTMLRIDITIALDTLCHSIADGDSVSPNIEAAICTRILAYIADFDPLNKSFVVSLMARGSGRTTRIARWVARSVLLGNKAVCADEYCDLPSIKELSAVLTPTSAKCTAFRVDQDTDYIDLGHYTNILAMSLSDIPAYVKEEMAISKTVKLGSPSKSDRSETALEHVKSRIDFVHSKIVDGNHLERTRVKAALKSLSHRIHYQRIAVLKSGQNNGRSKSIQQYFKKT